MTRLLAILLLACAAALGGARADETPPAAPRRALVAKGETWSYLTGDQPAPASWIEPGYDDSAWPRGPSGFGYGDDDDATVLDDMKGRCVSLRLRRTFAATAQDAALPLVLAIRSDDGFVAWLNGTEIGRARVTGSPPAPDAVAADHEASRVEEIAVPAGVLREGLNVLAISAHNSAASSTDFTAEPELLVGTPPAPREPLPRLSSQEPGATGSERDVVRPALARPAAASRWTFATTGALWRTSNYFQGRAGSPKEAVWGQVLREEIRFRPRDSPWRLGGRVEANRAGALGTSMGATFRASRSWGRHDLRLEADALWNRPAFRRGDQLATSDSAGVHVSWSFDVDDDITVAAWADAAREHLELDARRNNHDVTLGGSARFFRSSRRLSPEVGVETGRRDANAAPFEFDQRRAFVRLRSETGRHALSLLLRYGLREYPTGREDRRRLARATWDMDLGHGLVLSAHAAWEDGQSSLDSRPFESWTGWSGLRWTP